MNRAIFALFLAMALSSCAPSAPEKKDILLRIDNYSMSADEFLNEVKSISEFRRADQTKEALLDDIIEKKLLLLEAQREGLDKKADFRKIVQRFWEQSLLRVVVERKMKEFCPNQRPTEKEKIEACRQFEEWQGSLKKKARIYINQEALNKIGALRNE